MLTRFSPDLLGSEETVTSFHLLEILNVAGHLERTTALQADTVSSLLCSWLQEPQEMIFHLMLLSDLTFLRIFDFLVQNG